MFLMRGGRINQDQGQGWVWGWENVIPEEIIVLYRSVNWCVCHWPHPFGWVTRWLVYVLL
jgi:hypothetical protein